MPSFFARMNFIFNANRATAIAGRDLLEVLYPEPVEGLGGHSDFATLPYPSKRCKKTSRPRGVSSRPCFNPMLVGRMNRETGSVWNVEQLPPLIPIIPLPIHFCLKKVAVWEHGTKTEKFHSATGFETFVPQVQLSQI